MSVVEPAAGRAMEVTVGLERGFAGRPDADETLRRLADMGVTSAETYVRWIDFEPAEGRMDWSVFDADLEALLAHGLRWVPFLIAGPWYATPEWFRRGPRSVFARCLEHGRETGTQSIWNPHLFPEVRRLMAAFAERYGASPGPAGRDGPGAVESLLLGVTGDYGEAIYTVVGNWPGDYHGHAGYWCGDLHALNDFRAWARGRYGDLGALGAAWAPAPVPRSWDAVVPPRSAASPRAWLDFVEWYRGAMTAWAGRWLEAARHVLPGTRVYLCTGGDMLPAHGSDFSEQCRVAAAAGAGVRITNEGSDYVQNLMLTRLVASACRRHGTFFGFEPAAAVTPAGIAARQWNASASGARQIHEYQGNLLRGGEGGAERAAVWERGRPWLVQTAPRPQVALVHSLPDLALREAGLLGGALALARALRPVCDFEVLDDHLLAAGALAGACGLRAAFLSPARWWSAEAAARLRAFVAAGGICVASGARPAIVGEAGPPLEALFGFTPEADECVGISAVVPLEGGPFAAPDAEYRRLPSLHLARAFDGLDPAVVPLLRLAHTPASGRPPLVLWYRPEGRGAAVFYAGTFAVGEDWMSVRGAAEALIRDLLRVLPGALGLPPVDTSPTAGVMETWVDPEGARDEPAAPAPRRSVLGWNASAAPVTWRGQELAPWGMGRWDG